MTRRDLGWFLSGLGWGLMVTAIIVGVIVLSQPVRAQTQSDQIKFMERTRTLDEGLEICQRDARARGEGWQRCTDLHEQGRQIALQDYMRATERSPQQVAPLPYQPSPYSRGPSLPVTTDCRRTPAGMICHTY